MRPVHVPILDLLPDDVRSRVAGLRATLADWAAGPPSGARRTRVFDPPVSLRVAAGWLERYRGLYRRCALRLEDGSVLWADPSAFIGHDATEAQLRVTGVAADATDGSPKPGELIAPLDRSYWVKDGEVVAGFFPGSPEPAQARSKLERLVYFGVRHIVNLMEEDERDGQGRRFAPYVEPLHSAARELGAEVSVERHPIPDMGTTAPARMRAILDSIDAAVAGGRMVYVHCWGGKGRTGTVVGCWLARHGIAEGDEVLARIRVLRSGMPPADAAAPSPETEAQRSMVRQWRRGE